MSQIQVVENGIFCGQKWPNLGLNNGHAQARIQEDVTKIFIINYFYTKNVSKVLSKSDEPNSSIIENSIFWDQKWPNLGLNDAMPQGCPSENYQTA